MSNFEILQKAMAEPLSEDMKEWLEGKRRNYTCISCYYFKQTSLEIGECLFQKDNTLQMSISDKCDEHCLANKPEFHLKDVSKEELLQRRINPYDYIL